MLETRLDVHIRRRGGTFRVSGAQAESAEGLLRELFALTKSDEVTPERVHLAPRERESGPPPPDADASEHGSALGNVLASLHLRSAPATRLPDGLLHSRGQMIDATLRARKKFGGQFRILGVLLLNFRHTISVPCGSKAAG